MYIEENLKRCVAYLNGECLFGCDVVADSFYGIEEEIQNNHFDCYRYKTACQLLKYVKEKIQK